MDNQNSRFRSIIIIFIKVLQYGGVLFLAALLIMFFVTRSRIDQNSRRLIDEIEELQRQEIMVSVRLEDSVPVDITVPLGELLDPGELIPSQIPFSTSIPIKTTLHIDQVYSIPLELPVIGSILVDVPIKTDIPVNQTVSFETVIDIDPSAFKDPDKVIQITRDISIGAPLDINLTLDDLELTVLLQELKEMANALRGFFFLARI